MCINNSFKSLVELTDELIMNSAKTKVIIFVVPFVGGLCKRMSKSST